MKIGSGKKRKNTFQILWHWLSLQVQVWACNLITMFQCVHMHSHTYSTRQLSNALTDPVKPVFSTLVLLFGLQSRFLTYEHSESWKCWQYTGRVNNNVRMNCLCQIKLFCHAHIPVNNQYATTLSATTQFNLIKSDCTKGWKTVCECVRQGVSLPRQAIFPPWCSRFCLLGAPGYRCETGTCKPNQAFILIFTSIP